MTPSKYKYNQKITPTQGFFSGITMTLKEVSHYHDRGWQYKCLYRDGTSTSITWLWEWELA